MAPRQSPRSLRAEYQVYVEREIEDYKNSVSTVFLHNIAAEAARALDEGFQLGMREVMLADEVDRIIAKRLRLPPDTPLAQAITPGMSAASVLVAGPRVEGSALYLAANGCEVTAVESEVAVVNRVLRAAQESGLTEKLRGFVADLVSYTPDGPLAAVVCTPAAFAGLSSIEREQVIALLQQATSDGGVHLIETLVAGQAVLTEAELRTSYKGWEIKMVPEPGASQTFMAKKLVA